MLHSELCDAHGRHKAQYHPLAIQSKHPSAIFHVYKESKPSTESPFRSTCIWAICTLSPAAAGCCMQLTKELLFRRKLLLACQKENVLFYVSGSSVWHSVW